MRKTEICKSCRKEFTYYLFPSIKKRKFCGYNCAISSVKGKKKEEKYLILCEFCGEKVETSVITRKYCGLHRKNWQRSQTLKNKMEENKQDSTEENQGEPDIPKAPESPGVPETPVE